MQGKVVVAQTHGNKRVAAMAPDRQGWPGRPGLIRRVLIALAAGLALSGGCELSAAAPVAAKAGVALTPSVSELKLVRSVEGIDEYRLPNGLQLLLIPDASKPTTTVNMTYRVGSRFENYGETGMAHLLEHLMFKGTPRNPQVWADFNKRGFSANGSTWYDRTNYFASFSANDDNLRWYLDWQADAMVNSFIARKDLDSEMTVVRNEMEMGENDAGRILMEKTLAAMFQWHNYGKSTIGARTDVEGVDITRLQAFYKRYYQPDNATLIVSGKFDVAKVLGWVQQSFGRVPKPTRKLEQPYTLDPVQDGERSVTLRRVGGVPQVFAAYHVMPGAHPDFAAIELLPLILADTPSGRLHKNLVEGQQAAGVFGFSEGLADPGFILFGAQLSPQQDLQQASQNLLKVLESVRSEPISAAEVERARAKWLKSWDMHFADPQRVGVALSEAVSQGDWRLFFLVRDRVKAIQAADVQRVADQVLRTANRTLGQYIPTAAPERALAPARVDVAAQLQGFQGQAAQAAAETFDASPANIDARTHRFELPSGLKAALLSKSTRGQAVKATLTLRFGTADSLAGWGEAPSALAALLDKGTADMDRQAFQDRLDALQSEVGFSAAPGQLTVSIASRRDHVADVIRLVGRVLRQPSLPAGALEEVRQQALSGLAEQSKEPEAVLDNAISRYGNPYPRGDVRYARTFDEQEADWKGISLDRVKGYHQRFVSAAHGQFAAVGEFDEAAVKRALNEALGDWRLAEPYARVPDPLVPVVPQRFALQTPDKQNATFSAHLALPITDQHPDYAAFMLANHLLGSGGDSRLWNRIREKEGLSYSVYSAVQWNPLDANSEWVASAIFAPQNRDKVEQAFKEELARALKDGFTQSEFDAGRRGLLNFRRLSRAQDGRLAGGLAGNLYLGRDFSLAAKVDATLEALKLEQVNAALRRYLKPEAMVTGVAGDFTAAAPKP
jgi:zinc protease